MGSLRIIRNGIGIQEQASIDLPGIKGMWALTLREGSAHHDTLVLAFVGQTRVLTLNGEEVEETEIKGFAADRQTFFTGNVGADRLVQVTDSGIRLVRRGPAGWAFCAEWRVPGARQLSVVACAGARVVAAAGPRLHLVRVAERRLEPVAEVCMDEEVACLDVGPGDDSALLGVGLWTDISVRVLRLPDLTPLHTEKLAGEIIPRSLLICVLEGVWYLLCALGDGSMFYFTLDPVSGALTNRKKVTLGTQPTVLRSFRWVRCGEVAPSSAPLRSRSSPQVAVHDEHLRVLRPAHRDLLLQPQAGLLQRQPEGGDAHVQSQRAGLPRQVSGADLRDHPFRLLILLFHQHP